MSYDVAKSLEAMLVDFCLFHMSLLCSVATLSYSTFC